MNHCACGASHSRTLSHLLNQESSSAIRAQKPSGSVCASERSDSNSAIDLICACLENCSGGGKTRSSVSTESMFVTTLDIIPLSTKASLLLCVPVYHRIAWRNKTSLSRNHMKEYLFVY